MRYRDNVTELTEGSVHVAFIVLAQGLESLHVLRVRVANVVMDEIRDSAPLRRHYVRRLPIDSLFLQGPDFTGSLGDDRARHLGCSVGDGHLLTAFTVSNTSHSRWNTMRWLPPAIFILETGLYTFLHTVAELRLGDRVIRLDA